ncbi:hypothetical protein DFA_00364 [Cavenderia fasciculata]|uniref:Uncharacterized protein n=1 Tax=Cavenderia fasciculata TaxID=261658 RepID=F4PRF1_CACFS|nr:uncharacterized protein DFA_00364 [Cavenderia fasciculata]EGG20503.1 hypothetical protein DFA_00364 [Cavenderia fasciculata]|eukprot:XP_004358353.1 hypothetical protein DFA_00364 [Cavenderia fasciculata]
MAKEKIEIEISDALKRLLVPQDVVVSRYKTQDAFRDALQRGFFLVKFPKMFGGSELGVSLVKSTPKDKLEFEWLGDQVKVIGKLEFQNVPTKFKGSFNLSNLEGTGLFNSTTTQPPPAKKY